MSRLGPGAGFCLILSACAGSAKAPSATLAPQSAPVAYTLTEEELGLDCKRLTGRMQVRILQIRDYQASSQGSLFSRALQSATTSLIGGSAAGSSPDARYAQDRAVLEAYNRRLADKGCPTFDLEAELRPKPVMETPTPGAAAVTPAE